jgi:hypothetical protein
VSPVSKQRTNWLIRKAETGRQWEGAAALLADVFACVAGGVLVWAAAVVGHRLRTAGVNIDLDFPPLFASWAPHVGPGTIPAILIAAAIVVYGPAVARRWRWAPLLMAAYAASLTWTVSLTLIDGWEHGVLDKLTSDDEYLHDIPRVGDIPAMLREFSRHILDFQPGAWTTHVAGHPPGAFLIFIGMQRIGLGGGVWAAVLCVLVGASACTAVAMTLRVVGGEELARRVLPFATLMPAAVWIGVSADGLFAGVLAWGVALLAIGAATSGLRGDITAVAGGLMLGFTLYLSYGLAVAGPLAVAVIAVTPRARTAVVGALGALAVVATFTASGFSWWEGYELLKIRYEQGIAATRPYSYFAWANLAALVLVLGPAALAGMRRFVTAPASLATGARYLTLAAATGIVVADLSGMSKGEVERIWLPLAMWLVLPCRLLPSRQLKGWLLSEAVLALLINHLLRTRW